MYGVAISLILLFPWALVALATVRHLRSRRVPFQLDASRSNGMPPYGMGRHAKALERDALNLTSVPYANGRDGAERQSRRKQLERC